MSKQNEKEKGEINCYFKQKGHYFASFLGWRSRVNIPKHVSYTISPST